MPSGCGRAGPNCNLSGAMIPRGGTNRNGARGVEPRVPRRLGPASGSERSARLRGGQPSCACVTVVSFGLMMYLVSRYVS